ncbi:protein of unknown function [Rhodovastum atsumiense]|nr:protein of unknown function [Rhodovastum atsumiense]
MAPQKWWKAFATHALVIKSKYKGNACDRAQYQS